MAGYQQVNLECDIDGGCGSSDAMVINADGSHHCFSCGKTSSEKLSSSTETPIQVNQRQPFKQSFRTITADILNKYGCVEDETSVYYPFYSEDNLVGYKVRNKLAKAFRVEGNINQELFGQRLFNGGKYITICEGQDDAMAIHQMFGAKYASVSINSASTGLSDIKRNIEYIQTFDNIVLCMDNDEAGTKASNDIAEFIGGSNVKIMTLNKHKDANDYLKAGDTQAFIDSFWNAKQYSPAGVVMFADAWEFFEGRNSARRYPLPDCFNGVNEMLNGGIGQGEITTIGALTSIGKTTVVNNIVYGLLNNTEDLRLGYFGAETDVGELVEGLMSIHTETNLANKDISVSSESLKQVHESLEWKNRLAVLNHDGSMSTEQLMNKIKAMVKMLDLDVFILDPLQATLQNLDNATVEDFMDRCLKLVKSTNTSLVLVSHMKKPDTRDAHSVSEYDLKGSSAINQVSFNTILLSRDKSAEDTACRHSTRIQVVKARKGKDTGEAGWFTYDPMTTKIKVTNNPYRKEEE